MLSYRQETDASATAGPVTSDWGELEIARHMTDEYCVLDLYVPGTVKGQAAMAHMRREVHLVNDLKARMLMGMDILGPERILVDAGEEKLIIRSCDNLSIVCSQQSHSINLRSALILHGCLWTASKHVQISTRNLL